MLFKLKPMYFNVDLKNCKITLNIKKIYIKESWQYYKVLICDNSFLNSKQIENT